MTKINQIELIGAITKHLAKRHKITTLPVYGLNAIIKAANLIVEECERERRPATPGMGYEAWLNCDDTGMSSKFMASVLNGSAGCEFAYPHDADDFGRCVRMLDAIPLFRQRLTRLESHGPIWTQLAQRWDELEELYRTDAASLSKELWVIADV